MKYLFIFCLSFLFVVDSNAQANEQELFEILRQKDSLLFEVAFNKCDMGQLEKLISENFEFYHDKGGITPNKKAFVESMKNGLCKDTANYRSRRELIPGSLKVYPLANNGKLYGAIQTGDHKFFEMPKGQPERAGSKAKFTHLWLLENGEWKLARGLSYDHRM